MEGDGRPVSLVDFDADQPAPRSTFGPVFGGHRSFPEPPFGYGQDRGIAIGLNNDHADHVIGVIQANAPNSSSGPAHRPDGPFPEPDDQAFPGAQHDVAPAVRDFHADELVAFLQGQGDDPARAGVPVG